MNRNPSIQLKSTFLLLVFLFNTVVGFACAIGLDMGFKRSHHQEEKTAFAHQGAPAHQHAKPHVHHQQNNPAKDHHSSKKKDNCCTDDAAKFAKLDKLTPQSLDFSINLAFLTTFLPAFYHFDFFALSHITHNKFFVRTHHPPIPDIRLAIQSFQI